MEAPKHLKAAGRRLWNETVGGWAVPAEQSQLLVNVCESQDRICVLQKLIERDGPVVDGRFGLRAHPASQLLRSEIANFSQLYRLLQLEAPAETEDDSDV